MKKKFAAAVLLSLFAATAVHTALADTYVYDFEDGNADNWSIRGADMEVADSESFQNNALLITGDSTQKSRLKFNFDNIRSEGAFVVSYAVKPTVLTNRYYNIVGLQQDGSTDFASVALRHKSDGGFYFDPSGSNNAGTWFCNMSVGDWRYISLLVNNEEHTVKIAYVRRDGSVERDDAIRKTGKFSDKIAGGINGFQIDCDPYKDGDKYWIDDFIVSDIGTEDDYAVLPVKTNFYGKAAPEDKTVSLKYPVCFVNKDYATKDKVKITAVKNGQSVDVDGFDIDMTPNCINIEFDEELIANADYTVSFDNSVKNAFGQCLADYTFKTAAKQGTCLVNGVELFAGNTQVTADNAPENISKIEITYENQMVSGFELVKADKISFDSSYDSSEKKQILTLTRPLVPFGEYELIIPSELTDENGNTLDAYSFKFSTVKGKYDISYDITKQDKAVTSLSELQAGDEINVKATLTDTLLGKTDGYLWVGFYGENNDIKSLCSPAVLHDSLSAEKSYVIPQGTKEIRINVTDNSFRPLGKKCIVTGGGISE